MPNDKPGWGGARKSTHPNAKKRGPAPRFATIRIDAAEVAALLTWLNEYEPPKEHPAYRGWGQAIAGLWAEAARQKERL